MIGRDWFDGTNVSVTSIVQIQSAIVSSSLRKRIKRHTLGGCCYECAANENNRYVIEHNNISQEEQAAVLAQLASEVTV